jgi:DNA-binding NtrC family response regulator
LPPPLEPQLEPAPAARRYRLRGEVGGVLRSYPVAGLTRIGSMSGNDVVLPVRGVSREHARLSVGGSGLVLEDLESKNGTFVDGDPVQRADVRPGQELRFGPLRLLLEEVEAGDAELAIVGARAPAAGVPAGETTQVATERRSRAASWLVLVERVLGRLAAAPAPDLPGALGVLLKELPARGACVVDFPADAPPVVIAARGGMEPPFHDPAFQAFMTAAPPAGEIATAVLQGDPALSCALLAREGGDGLGLVVWGHFPGRGDSDPLLRVLLALLARFTGPDGPLGPRPGRAADLPRSPTAELAFPEGYIPGQSAPMMSLYGQMRPLLRGDLPVLLLGETGVGKEYLARILHLSSDRSRGPFVAINCAAIPSELLEAELFGIGKGVATGVLERPGKFQLAERGTLFLDEIGEMPADLQAKLLRALQEKEVQPVGSGPVSVDIRVVAATNTDLQARMEDGRFRRDLYYRVAGCALRIPSLRERKEDVPVLVEQLVQGFAREAGKPVAGVTVRALRLLVEYPWPGNVRELQHELRRLVYLCPDGQAIDSTMLSSHFAAQPLPAAAAPAATDESLAIDEHVRTLEVRLIQQALARSGGNRTQAAALLGISRNGLAIKMERLGIAHPDD